PVMEYDLPRREDNSKSTLTPVVISNMDEIKELIKLSGSVTVGETPVIRIKK
ncbi:PTS glucose transporter subunit IIA, partial [Klebsiella pneumoniae]